MMAIRIKRRQNIKEEYLTSQLTALRSQMNPHFLYNVLNTLQGLIFAEKIENASQYIGTFSDHLRKTLDASENNSRTIEEELEALNLYLALEKMRFGDQLDIQIKLDSKIDKTGKIPSMIIQPIVENALKHGLLHKLGEKKLKIEFAVKERDLEITIVDNGVGRKKSQEINIKNRRGHRSFAINSILKRIEILNKMKEFQINYEVRDTFKSPLDSENPGTTVSLIIKNYLRK
jgi:LytS/YehU family sensor histidine kinase